MITTTLALVALTSGLDLGVSPFTPSWQTDYAKAMTRASSERKPMVVVIGQGSDKVKRMLADGAISADASKLLQSSFVCLYLDVDTAAGKDLAGRFQMSEGLVISSPGGNVQAYRHVGAVAGADLTKQLSHYATAGQPTTTVSAGLVPPTQYPTGTVFYSGGCANGSCQTIYPTSGQYVTPGTVYQFGSSCPNGRCPNQR